MKPEDAKKLIKEILNNSDYDFCVDSIIDSMADYIECKTKEDIARHGL